MRIFLLISLKLFLMLCLIIFIVTSICSYVYAATEITPLTIDAIYVKPAPVLDGKLDDACWSQATQLEDFFVPDAEIAVPEKTVALICVDEQMLYVAFRCYDRTPDDIMAKETRRNGAIFRDDFVILALDPWHKHQDLYQFFVTAGGTQTEQIPGGSATKIEWRGDWSGAAVRTDYGWSAEMAIPYAILPIAAGQNTFGIFVARKFAKENLMIASPITGKTIDVKQGIDLTGLRLPRTSSHPVVMTYSTFDSNGSTGFVEAGVDVQYKLANGLTALGTANPDFKQVEDVVEPISFSYTERYLPDLRPFFVTGQNGFLPREHLLYTRRIENFDAGMKLFGTVGDETIGILNAFTRDQQNVFASSWRHKFNEQDTARFLFVSDARKGDPETVGYGGLAYGVDAARNRTTSEGNDRMWFVGYGADSEEDGKGMMASIGGNHSRGSGKLSYDWMLRYTTEYFAPSLGYFPDRNSYGGNFSLIKWTRHEAGSLESHLWIIGLNYFPELNGEGMQQAMISPGRNWTWRNGRFLDVGMSFGRQYGYDGKDTYLAYGWNQKDLYTRGQMVCNFGARAGGDYKYLSVNQGFHPAEKLSINIGAEYGSLVGSPEDDGRFFQGVLMSSYDLTTERSIGTRIICRNDGFTGYAAYRQVIRHGLDVYVLFGDPDPEQTRFEPRVMVKLIRTL